MARARRAVDPDGTGFDAQMRAYDGMDFFPTDDLAFGSGGPGSCKPPASSRQASTRVGLAIMTTGTAVAASHLYDSAAGARYADVTLAASGVFAVWFVVSAAVSAVRGR